MKISIVIPTRNRSEFLRYCVATCLASDDDNIEVVVSDNNSIDDTQQVIQAINDPRLKNVCTGQDLSMRQNFEFALQHATGEYLIFIGDDDGILPNGLVTLRGQLAKHDPDIVLWRHITYDWPRGDGSIPGRLKFRCQDFCGPMRFIDPKQAFNDFCQAKHTNYRSAANIYHGCVHRRVIDTVRDRQGGVYFNDSNPDINTAFTNLLASRSIVWFRNPATIAGAGEKSTGYAFTPRTSISNIQKDVTKDFSKLFAEDEIKPKVAVAIRCIFAHTYANLCSVHRQWGVQDAAIDHTAWRRVIMDDMKTFKPENRRWDVLENFFQEVDATYESQNLMACEPEAMSPPDSTERAAAPTSSLASNTQHADHLRNVQTAMQWIQEVTGKPYTPSANPAIALAKQACRSIGMHQRIKAIRSRA